MFSKLHPRHGQGSNARPPLERRAHTPKYATRRCVPIPGEHRASRGTRRLGLGMGAGVGHEEVLAFVIREAIGVVGLDTRVQEAGLLLLSLQRLAAGGRAELSAPTKVRVIWVAAPKRRVERAVRQLRIRDQARVPILFLAQEDGGGRERPVVRNLCEGGAARMGEANGAIDMTHVDSSCVLTRTSI